MKYLSEIMWFLNVGRISIKTGEYWKLIWFFTFAFGIMLIPGVLNYLPEWRYPYYFTLALYGIGGPVLYYFSKNYRKSIRAAYKELEQETGKDYSNHTKDVVIVILFYVGLLGALLLCVWLGWLPV